MWFLRVKGTRGLGLCKGSGSRHIEHAPTHTASYREYVIRPGCLVTMGIS